MPLNLKFKGDVKPGAMFKKITKKYFLIIDYYFGAFEDSKLF